MSQSLPFSGLFSANLLIASGLCLLLVLIALRNFSQTGPRLRQEVLRVYAGYSIHVLIRQGLWVLLLLWWLGSFGLSAYLALCLYLNQSPNFLAQMIASLTSIILISGFQLCRQLLYIPCSIMMSSHYSMKRLIPVWQLLSVTRLRWFGVLLWSAWLMPLALLLIYSPSTEARVLSVTYGLVLLPLLWVFWPDQHRFPSESRPTGQPNILMIGCDTLRADRLGLCGYPRNLTPYLDSLGKKGTLFSNCYTPVARTAPSLASIFTGTWPVKHGIRTNFTTAQSSPLPTTLAHTLSQQGYQTATISDWSGSDLGKFDFGFDIIDVPPDQWNLKYLIRQGPKHLRLYLTLFTHNRFGKAFLPELYYLAGKPLTSHLGRAARRQLTQFAHSDHPFFLNLFMGTTHPPFGPEYPYYTRFGDEDYRGESKFGMAKLTDPDEIIQSQKEPRSAFDLDQITDLYDNCVQNFDDEVRSILHHLERCGLDSNTLVVIYSDHGMEFFEKGTWGQGNNVFGPASARIPLLIYDPRRAGQGQLDTPCRTVDLMPTLLELCGIANPPSVDGHSLAPLLAGQAEPARPCYFETGLWLTPPPGQAVDHIRYPELIDLLEVPDKEVGTLSIKAEYCQIIEQARDRQLRLGDWVLIRIALIQIPDYQLFNIKQDPDCLTNIADQHPEMLERLKLLMCRIDRTASEPGIVQEQPMRGMQ